MKVIFEAGARFWAQRLSEWYYRQFLGRGRRRPPTSWSWFSVMGKPLINDDGSCSIASSSMCVEAQHRLEFERVHGHGKFTFAAKNPTALKKKCRRRQVWDPDDGAWFGDVLDTIKHSAGVPTTKVPNDISLPLHSYDIHKPAGPLGGELRPLDLAWMIYKHGPVLGALLLDDDYDSSYVYPGVLRHVLKGDKSWDDYDGHGVVCFEYEFEGGDLLLRVMDNHEEDGPLKWIKFSAFHEFVRLHVKPIDPKLLRRNSKWRRSDLFDPFEYIANKLYYLR